MKFSINKDEIIHQLQSLAAVADKKQTLPILSNIYLKWWFGFMASGKRY